MAKKTCNSFQSAEVVKTADGRQYHIGIAPGEVAPFILMCGDPARVKLVAGFFDKIECECSYREYLTITGKYKGIPISVMATGMGPDNTEIALVELSQVVKSPTLIRIGTSGGLKKETKLGDLVISTGAVRLENTSTYFVHEGYPAVAHYEVVAALVKAASKERLKFHTGLTATAPGFYGAQGRKTPFFTPRDVNIDEKLAGMNVLNMEMEASTLFILSNLAGFRAGAVCAVIAERDANVFITKDMLKVAEMNCIKTGLGAVEILAKAQGE